MSFPIQKVFEIFEHYIIFSKYINQVDLIEFDLISGYQLFANIDDEM